MNCHLISAILCLINIALLSCVCGKAIQESLQSEELNKTQSKGYKWVSLKSGDILPENIVLIQHSGNRYVGRARHFDEILPAEITADGSAFISSCHKEIQKDQFEILTTSDGCEWKSYNSYGDLEETILRVGNAWNGEPIYIGKSSNYENIYHTVSMYLKREERYTWTDNQNYYYYSPNWQYLSCNVKNKWIDTSAKNLPNNSVSGGKSEDEYDIYVARVKRGCDIVTGQAIPDIGTATAFLNDNRLIESAYCQVLVGEPGEYTWVSASDGEIPDYAVAHGKKGLEVSYVARFNRTIGHLTHSEALEHELDYEILINESNS
ncbi:uncharacterized protein LOC129908399 isoform X2 [Episyrphus balteatus]|uniref:uncharacterized protein LOC129908399 isoform X2 n=1 Tax=Episyrphus balteatus TaxID=286459 RepID=UPI00248570C0|nr:uncharacterized protein LOC129908399 isoform X2 [Episyrphus balteatus]